MEYREFKMWAQLAYCKEFTNKNCNDLKALMIILNYHNSIVRGSKWNNTPNKIIESSLGINKRNTITLIQRLVDMGLITKQTKVHNNANHLQPNLEAIENMIKRNMDMLGMVSSASPIEDTEVSSTSPTKVSSASPIEDTEVSSTSPTKVSSASPTKVSSATPNIIGTIKKEKEKNKTPYNPPLESSNHLFSFDASQAGTDSQSNDISIEPSDDDDYISSMEDVFNASCTVQYAAVNLDGEIHSPSNVRTAMEETNTPLSPTIKVCAPSSKVCHSAKDLLRLMEVMDTNNPTDEDFNILMESSVMDSLIDMTLSTVIHIAESGHKDAILNEVLDNEFKTINGLSKMNYRKTSYIAKYNEARTLLNAA